MKYCVCGCGKEVSKTARFAVGHYLRTISPEERSRMARLGNTSEKQRKISLAHWNKTTKAERFWQNVVKSDGCWYREGSKEGCYDGERHRIAWELTFGEIPEGLYVLHKCDNRRCTRPDHLFLGTQAENMQDMVQKGRFAKKHNTDQRGEKNNAAKHNNETIKLAKRLLANGERQCDVMRKTGLSRANVWCIAHGISWQSV